MRAAARTQGTHSLATSLQAAKPAGSQLPGQESFRLRWQSALSTPAGIAGPAQRQAGDKAKALKDGDAADAAALKTALAKKGSSATSEAADKAKEKDKTKQLSKPDGATSSAGDAKVVDGAAIGLPLNSGPDSVQPVNAVKKESADANGPGINSASNSASTSTLQQAQLPPDMAVGPVEIAGTKQAETSASETKTKRAIGSAIAALSDKPAAGAVGVDGSATGISASGMAVGGVAGAGVQGGHSSGSSGHGGQQPTTNQAAAGAGPQLVASSPSQLDVGVYDDTHGWLRIRAELGAGGAVNATVTSADAAHESLKTALPAMTHYLGAESVHVNSIELQKFGDAGGGQPGSHADGQQQGSTTGQHTSGDEQQQARAQANAMAILGDAASRSAAVTPDEPSGTEVEAVGAATAVAATGTTDPVDEVTTASTIAARTESTGDLQMTDMLGTQVLPWQVGVGGSGGWVNVSA